MKQRASISDIARRAGVSVGTVSNVLNGIGRHAESTRKRIKEIAEELHFRPNALIRSLQSGQTHTIGVFMWRITLDVDTSVTMRLLTGIADGIAATTYDTLLYSRHPLEGDISPSLFLDGRVDGLIIAPGGLDYDGLKALAAAGLPTVALYEDPVPEGVGAVNIDNVGGMRAAVEHLASLGHHRIAFCGPNIATYDFRRRRQGYRRGLEQRGLTYDPELDVEGGRDPETGVRELCNHLLALRNRPSAVIVSHDDVALALVRKLGCRGVRVPEEMSVVGFDDSAGALLPPGLTTVRQPAERVGQLAATFVHQLIAGEPAVKCRVLLPVELVVRDTTAPPAVGRRYFAAAALGADDHTQTGQEDQPPDGPREPEGPQTQHPQTGGGQQADVPRAAYRAGRKTVDGGKGQQEQQAEGPQHGEKHISRARFHGGPPFPSTFGKLFHVE